MILTRIVLLLCFTVVAVRGKATVKRDVSDASCLTAKVETTSGITMGKKTEEGYEFHEIPYAEPPVGKFRWQNPRPITSPRPEMDSTTNHYLHCYGYPGHCRPTDDAPCPLNQSEDCLIVSIFVPNSVNLCAGIPSERLPVLFHIHGGAFKIFSGTSIRGQGEELAKVTNTVVVAINYRLGALGFLAHEAAGQEDLKGNQGLKDQRLAMQWVQNNIENFGGDKHRVTLFGNSAGAQSIAFHATSAKSRDLYTSAIQESNPNIYSFFYPDREAALRVTDRLVKAMGCGKTPEQERQCLMDASPEEVMRPMPKVEKITTLLERNIIYGSETFMPMVDGEELTDQISELYRTGRWNKDKNMIIGVNTQEMEDLQYKMLKPGQKFGEIEFKIFNTVLFGKKTGLLISEKYMSWYPRIRGWDLKTTIGIMWSQLYFDCPNREVARYASDTTEASVYYFTDSHPVINQACMKNGGNKTGCGLATHSSEIHYVFRTTPHDEDFTEVDQTIEDEFSTYYGSFARTGDPSNGLEKSLGDFARWPEYKRSQENGVKPWSYMHITTPTSKVESVFFDEICDFWESIHYGLPRPALFPKLGR